MPGSQKFFNVGDGSYQYYANNLAVDMQGAAHIVYHNSSDKLRYRRWTGNGWTSGASPDHVVEDNEQGW